MLNSQQRFFRGQWVQRLVLFGQTSGRGSDWRDKQASFLDAPYKSFLHWAMSSPYCTEKSVG